MLVNFSTTESKDVNPLSVRGTHLFSTFDDPCSMFGLGLQNKQETQYYADSSCHHVEFKECIVQVGLPNLNCRRQGAGQMRTSDTAECNSRQTEGSRRVGAQTCRSVCRKLLGHSKRDQK